MRVTFHESNKNITERQFETFFGIKHDMYQVLIFLMKNIKPMSCQETSARFSINIF